MQSTDNLVKLEHKLYISHAVAYLLRHYAAKRKVAGSIPDEAIFFKFT
jgi:hypothetical protein